MVGLLAHSKKKKNVMEWPLHEQPQKVGDYVFSVITQSPSLRFWPPVPFVIVLSLTLLSHPSSTPATTLSVLSAFTQAAQWAARKGGGPRCILGSESSCYVLTEVASWCTLKLKMWCSALKIPSSCFVLGFFLFIGNHNSHLPLGLIVVWKNLILWVYF